MTKYEMTQNYWNKIFDEMNEGNPNKPIKYSEIEEGLQWLVGQSESVLDFGCGSGQVLLRSMMLGLEKGFGIDISCSAIELAKKNVRTFNIKGQVGFKCAELEYLKNLEPSSFDGAILFNIIDNMYPTDAMEVIKCIHKSIRVRGRALMKLNPWYPESHFDKNPLYRKITSNFYLENTGVYFWNLSYEDVEDFLNPYFIIEKYIDIDLDGFEISNRLFYLRAM